MDIKRWLSKNSSGICAFAACVGVVVTAVLTYKGTIKAQKRIEEWSKEKQDELTTFEKVQASAKPLAPAVIAGAATIGSIITSHKITKEHIAVITASGAGIAKKYDDYRKANIEVNGKEAHDRVMEKLEVQEAKESNLCAESMFTMTSLNSKLSTEEFLFHDDITDQYFTASLAHVLDAINHLNRNFTMGHPEVDVQMWCDFLGIENKKKDTRGWFLCDDYTWIDFDISNPVEIEDGLEVITIVPSETPIEEHWDYDCMGEKYDDIIKDSQVPF